MSNDIIVNQVNCSEHVDINEAYANHDPRHVFRCHSCSRLIQTTEQMEICEECYRYEQDTLESELTLQEEARQMQLAQKEMLAEQKRIDQEWRSKNGYGPEDFGNDSDNECPF